MGPGEPLHQLVSGTAVPAPARPALWLVVPMQGPWPLTEALLESLQAAAPRGLLRVLAVEEPSGPGPAALALRDWRRRLPLTVLRRRAGGPGSLDLGLRLALKGGADWIGLLHHDLLLGPGCLDRMLHDAAATGWQAVSPATRAGVLDYDFSAAAAAQFRSGGEPRAGACFEWCVLLTRRAAGLLGRLEADAGAGAGTGTGAAFAVLRLAELGLACGVSRGALVHHFGPPAPGRRSSRLKG